MTASRLQPITLAVTAVLAAGCGARDRRTPDDTVVVLVSERINNLDPRYTETSADVTLSRLVVPGLTTIETPTLEPALLLAESIDVRSEAVDVVLRPDVRFSDGSPVTADDVVFTYESVRDPAMGSPLLGPMRDRFSRIEALDARRVRFHLVAPLATVMTDLDFGILSRRAAGPDGRFAGGRVVGAGPYAIESFGHEVLLLGRSRGWSPTPRCARVKVQVVRDASARALMLVGGSADLTQNTLRIDLADDLEQRGRVRLTTGPGARLTYLMMNTRDPALSDVRVRQAIAYAIDRERVVRSKLDGRAALANGLLPPGHWAHGDDITTYRRDLARARALLDEAGLRDPDGPGPRPRLSLSYKTSSDQLRVALARIWAAQLGEVGIEVDVQSFEFTTVLADYKRGNFQLGSLQSATIAEPDFLFAYFHSSRIPTAADPNALNRFRYASPRLDALVDAGRRTLDRGRRRALYLEAQEILARELPVIPLWHEDNVAVANVDLVGFELTPAAQLGGLAAAGKRP